MCHYVPTNQNPADIPTREMNVSEISQSKLWWNGPEWLRRPQILWPKWNIPSVNLETEMEVKGPTVLYETNMVANHDRPFNSEICGIDHHKYSSLRKLLRITVYCLKFIEQRIWMILSQVQKEWFGKNHLLLHKVFNLLLTDSFVHAEDIRLAANLWIYCIQQCKFKDIFFAVQMNRKHCLKKQLGLQIDDVGILRCHGRYLNAIMSESAKYPKLLPRHEHFAHMLINEVHVCLIHSGMAHTLAQIREEYWIPQGRTEVRKVLSKCLICRRYEGSSFQLPRMPPWPRKRVSRSDPFQFVGLDYLGPINVREGSEELKKTWVCLFTCLTVRAIHLEWITDLTAVQFLSCLRRFVSRRGRPELIISDNAPQFKLTFCSEQTVEASFI